MGSRPRVRRLRVGVGSALLLTLLLAACSSGSSSGAADSVTLVTHDSFAASKPVLRAFTRQTGIKVKVLKNGDAGAALNQVILTKSAPLGDAFYGVDNTFLSRALDAGVFEPYLAQGLSQVPRALRLDRRHRVTPIDYSDVCINDDLGWFTERGLAPPQTLDDLTRSEYRGRLVVENPATSSPGLAFLLATVAKYGPNGWQDYWRKLRANDVKVVDGWEQAYNTEFSGAAGKGRYPLVVSYASSPPAEVYFADPKPAAAPTGNLAQTCFRQVEFAGVLKGAEHKDAARKLVDFLLARKFQADMPLQMFVYPARRGTPLPDVFTKFGALSAEPAHLPMRTIGRHRDAWIDAWTATVLR